jgi:hypothetical protein
MCRDFLSMRVRLATSAKIVVRPFTACGTVGGTCWHHVRKVIERLGGDFAYGWALSNLGPIAATSQELAPLYSRWVNHVLWREPTGLLWEVTPIRDEVTCAVRWMPTVFIPDEDACFENATDDICCPQPAVYVASSPEGEWASDCLCQAERANTREAQDQWVARAIYAIKQAGYSATSWRVKRVGNNLRDIWIAAK